MPTAEIDLQRLERIGESVSRSGIDGWRVLRATGVEAEESFVLGGLNQIVFGLRNDIAALDPHDREVLAPILGADFDASPSPLALTMALLALLTEAARKSPVLLAVEDVHWFDDLSAKVISAMGRRISDPRVRLVATTRSLVDEPFAAGWDVIDLVHCRL